jgi:hypothetical protein
VDGNLIIYKEKNGNLDIGAAESMYQRTNRKIAIEHPEIPLTS